MPHRRSSSPQAIRELHAVQSHPDTEVAATAALLAAHQTARVVDYDAIAEMTANLEVGCCSDVFVAYSLNAFGNLLQKVVGSNCHVRDYNWPCSVTCAIQYLTVPD